MQARPKRCANIKTQGKLNCPCDEKNWLGKDFSKLKQTWRSKIRGKKNSDIAFYEMKLIRNSNTHGNSNNRRINALIRFGASCANSRIVSCEKCRSPLVRVTRRSHPNKHIISCLIRLRVRVVALLRP